MTLLKTVALLFILILMSGLLAGCTTSDGKQGLGQKKDFTAENEALKKLLPEKEGFVWVYSGFVEYGYMMELQSVAFDAEQTTYTVSGEISDPSGGEAQGDFSLALTFTVKDGMLRQSVKAPRIMDTFAEMILLQAPLSTNHSWEQKVKDANGKEYLLVCTIEEIGEEKGLKTCTVVYKDKNSDFYEKRQFREKWGLLCFEKNIRLNNEPIVMGYALYEEASGYPADTK